MTMSNVGPCYKCRCEMWIPQNLEQAARRSSKIEFFCAYGHGQIFAEGESEETKLRRERDRLVQQAARLEDEKRRAEEEASLARVRAEKAEKATKSLKKRTSAGTCPCCNRTFGNMAEHMKHQHPEFVADSGAKVVPIKRKTA